MIEIGTAEELARLGDPNDEEYPPEEDYALTSDIDANDVSFLRTDTFEEPGLINFGRFSGGSSTYFGSLDGLSQGDTVYFDTNDAGVVAGEDSWYDFDGDTFTFYEDEFPYNTNFVTFNYFGDAGSGVEARGLPPIHGFSGTFNGRGNTVKNIDGGDSLGENGLFGVVLSDPEIKNLSVENATTSGNPDTAGLLVTTTIDSVTITNCNVEGEIDSGAFAGGIIGQVSNSSGPKTTIEKCSGDILVRSSGTVEHGAIAASIVNAEIRDCEGAVETTSSTNTVGGIIGYMAVGTIDNCHGEVVGAGDVFDSGSIVGGASAPAQDGTLTIQDCSGSIECTTGTSNTVGGCIGEASDNVVVEDGSFTTTLRGTNMFTTGGVVGGAGDNVEVRRCTSDHEAIAIDSDGSFDCGGIIANVGSNCSIEDCYATVKAEGRTTSVGGALGGAASFTDINIDSVAATVDISIQEGNLDNVGGIAGQIDEGTITNCYALGTISTPGLGAIGGILGAGGGSTISNCYSIVQIEGSSAVGGIAGEAAASINSCYTISSIEASGEVGSILGTGAFGAEASISDTYYASDVTGFANSVGESIDGTDNSTELSLSQMEGSAAESNMPGLSFPGVYESKGGRTPILSSNPEVSTVTGTVRDANGMVVEGVSVVVGSEETKKTNQNGEYTFSERQMPVSVLSLGGTQSLVYHPTVQGESLNFQFGGVEIIAESPSDGSPLPGLGIQIDGNNFITDSEGRVEVDTLFIRDYEVTVLGQLSQTAQIDSQGEIVTINASDESPFSVSVTVRVTDSNSGNTVKNITAQIIESDAQSSIGDGEQISLLHDIRRGNPTVRVGFNDPRYKTEQREVDVTEGDTSIDFEVEPVVPTVNF